LITYQDLLAVPENDKDRADFVRKVINEHQGSSLYRTALDADAYDRCQNTTIMTHQHMVALVTGQIPAPGSEIPGRSEVILYFNQEAPAELVEVPNFLDMTLPNARYVEMLSDVYMLVVGTNRDDIAVRATYQEPAAGTMVPPGTTVAVEFTDHSEGD